MKLEAASIDGVFLIDSHAHEDERGSFTRVFDRDVFARHGLTTDFPQHAVARNPRRGTLRGLHYQIAPFCESKLVHCIRGRVWDVVLDVRRSSRTFGLWEAFELSGDSGRQVYIGPGLAHGYVTLTDHADLHYLLSSPYSPAHAAGVSYLDPQANIAWPIRDVIVSSRDATLPNLADSIDPSGHSGSPVDGRSSG